ncbi:YaaR family protein [Saliterribacillus persicus]|uniref:DUF327 family protein n=1 Tax=Saliterribacillus persicus TaxID=930114 RepID=A0A368X4X9_9BACI|nr:YaaR family protein [Saliterribacillus persicus]RCW63072.1 hypothetical protein DFR57_12053 [Saliterribacillus persicus]
MKISQEMRAQLDTLNKQGQAQKNTSQRFDTMVKSESIQLKQAELQQLMGQLATQGEKIAKFRSFHDLAIYKRMVKRFVKEAVDFGMNLKQSHSFSMDGNNRKLTLVEEVDEKLVELTETVLDKEKNSINILDVIGEIKGLLINLYT